MSQGFYELLGVQPRASQEEIRQAFQGRLAALVRRLKTSRSQGADVSLLEAQERTLREAMEILADPARRRRYDTFREAAERDAPIADASELWQQCRGSLMDPATVSALNVVRALTELPLGEPIAGLPSRADLRAGTSRPSYPPPPAAAAPAPATAAAHAGSPPPLQMRPPSIAIAMPKPPPLGLEEGEEDRPTSPTSPSGVRSPGVTFAPRHRPAEPSAPPPPSSVLSMPMPAPETWVPPPRAAAPAPAPAPAPSPEPEAATVEGLARRYSYDGRFLRGVRELRGRSLEDLSRSTRISLRYLEALESNAFDRLPTRVFVRGYIKELAQELDIEDTDIVERYLALYDHHGG